MNRYILGRLAQGVLLVVVVSIATFALVQLAPGGLSILVDPDLDRAESERIARNLGLDRPLPIQYLDWGSRAAQGDLGRSFHYMRPVTGMIAERLPNTVLLAGASLLVALALGIPAGIIAATRQYSWYDHVLTIGSFVGFSIPGFWLGITLIIVFAVGLRWLPASGMYTIDAAFSLQDRLEHLVLPALVLGLAPLAEVTRYMRSSMLEILHQDYLRTARAKGLAERAVMARHALRNALPPVATIVGLMLPHLVGGSAVIEAVFGWPGIGQMAIEAAAHRDYPVILGATLLVSTAVILSNLTIDVLYGYIDPRIRVG